jgi:hypothetical protein
MNRHDHASSGDQHVRRGESRRFPSPAAAHPVLRLQRQAGNRAVSARLATPTPIPVQRDLGDEMRRLGLSGSDEDIAKTLAQLIGQAGVDTNLGGKARSLFGPAGEGEATGSGSGPEQTRSVRRNQGNNLRSRRIDLAGLSPQEKKDKIAELKAELAGVGQAPSGEDKTIEDLLEKIRAKRALVDKKKQLEVLQAKLAGKYQPSEEEKLDEELTALQEQQGLQDKKKELSVLQSKLEGKYEPTEEERLAEEMADLKKRVEAKAQQDKIAQSSKELLTTLRNAKKVGGSAALAGIPGGSTWLNMKKRTPDEAGSKSMIAERVTGGSTLMKLWRQARKQTG